MGLFDKIKNILFEDDEEEMNEIPVYSKEDVDTKETKREEKKKDEDDYVPIQTNETSRFRNVKRDFDFSFDEDEVLDEVIESEPVVSKEEEKEEKVEVKEEPVVVPQPEKKDVFLTFDEDEFERLNSRGSREDRSKRESRKDYTKDVKKVEDPMEIARRANNNFSSTTPTVNTKDVLRKDADRYRINPARDVKKPFTPSPVISPVYGILDKNYTKDSIVDKKDGMKRERIKPIKTEVVLNSELEKQVEKKRLEEEALKEDKKVNIDLVRRKAYGALEKNVAKLEEKPVVKDKNVVLTTVGEQEDFIDFQEQFGDDIVDDALLAVANYNTSKAEKEVNIEDKVEEDLNKSKVQEYDNSVKEVKKVSEEDNKSKLLDDLEKTSTLQILDDIEKELSSIKPISKSYQSDKEEYHDSNEDTLENDLFNLIDSMYEQGEEDEDE
ncbi:MAG: hypothetical protein ACI4OP_00820 [Candidatus Coprovivens sp.]